MSDSRNTLQTWGNETTMNLNLILYQNIRNSGYFKQLYEKKTYHQIIDEIYYHVDNLSPFLRGTTPSSCFCLLYKLWTLRLTIKQIYGLLDHSDSPHIRAIGFLYLRYVAKPENLWDWYEPYLEDSDEIQITSGPTPTYNTIGRICIDLLTEPKWLGTQLPRIPVPIARDLETRLAQKFPRGYSGGGRDGRCGNAPGRGKKYGHSHGSKPYDRPSSQPPMYYDRDVHDSLDRRDQDDKNYRGLERTRSHGKGKYFDRGNRDNGGYRY